MGRVIVADQVGPDVRPGLVSQARTAAAAILSTARAEAAETLRQAEVHAGDVIAKARIAATTAAHEEAIAATLAASAARDRALGDIEAEVITLAIAVTEKLLEASLQRDPQLIQAVVRPLLARVRRARRVALRLHPDDAQTIAPHLEALAGDGAVGCPLELEPDAALTRGSCVLVSDLGTLDGRLETRLARIARALEPLLNSPKSRDIP